MEFLGKKKNLLICADPEGEACLFNLEKKDAKLCQINILQDNPSVYERVGSKI